MKQKAACFVGLVFLFTVLVCRPATFAQDLHDISSMQCGDAIVDMEASMYEVKDKCGQPSDQLSLGPGTVQWVYDFGPDQLIYYLTFDDTQLSRIQTGDHGD
jgi:hypothetical protein